MESVERLTSSIYMDQRTYLNDRCVTGSRTRQALYTKKKILGSGRTDFSSILPAIYDYDIAPYPYKSKQMIGATILCPDEDNLYFVERTTCPLPIKKSNMKLYDQEISVNSSKIIECQYNWATWRMYHRITSARRRNVSYNDAVDMNRMKSNEMFHTEPSPLTFPESDDLNSCHYDSPVDICHIDDDFTNLID